MDGVYSSASIVNDKLRLTKVDGVNYDDIDIVASVDLDHLYKSAEPQFNNTTRKLKLTMLELRRSWQPNRNFVFNLRPSRRDEGHVLSKYSGKPKRSFSAQLLMLRRVDILLKPSASSETRRDATNSLTNFFAAGFFRGPGQFASDARFSRNKAPFLDDPRPLESFIRPSYTRRTRKS